MLANHGSPPPRATRPPPGPAPDTSIPWLQHAAGGQHRIEAHLSGFQFAPHRHDTYAVALTLEGVQCFDYRGSVRHSLPGGVVVIHPDECHDGRPGTADGFRYRSIHIEPARIQAMLADYWQALGDLELDDALFDLSTALAALSTPRRQTRPLDHDAAERAREYMLEHWNSEVSLACLERASGRDRWKLSRDFRLLFGTSPYRYLLMRRLERGRDLLADGHAPAEAAAACCFADQSHFTRHFRKAFGVTPGKWAGLA